MLKSKSLKMVLMIIIFGAILFAMPNFSKAASSEPNGIITEKNRSYNYIDSNGKTIRKSKTYLLCTKPTGPKCTSKTNWEIHVNLGTFRVYIYHKVKGKWQLYNTNEIDKKCAVGQINPYSGLSITNSMDTTVAKTEYYTYTRNNNTLFYCLWCRGANFLLHSGVYSGKVTKPKGTPYWGEETYCSNGCIRLNTPFIKKFYKEYGDELANSRVVTYYTSESIIMNPKKIKSGTITINNKTYYFNKDGYLSVGPVKINNTMYFFGIDGVQKKSTGINVIEDLNTYIKSYYYTKKGILQTGWQTVNNKTYYFSKNNYVARTGWQEINDKDYYFTKKGELKKGFFTVGKAKYYSDPKTGALKDGWQTISKKTYYFWKKNGKNLDEKHKEYQMATGLISLNGKLYYLSNEGVRQTGLTTIDKNKYYFDKKTGEACTGFKTIDKKAYYFWKNDGTNSGKEHLKATMATNNISLNGIPYLISKKGVIKTGWQTIDGKKHYYNTSTGEAYTGFKTINKKTYYFSLENGQMTVGLNKIDNKLYYFNEKGVRQTGWQKINNKKYYFQSNGIAYTDVTKKINKKSYTFDKNGVVI